MSEPRVPMPAARTRRPFGIPLGRVASIPIVVAPSWFLAAAVIVVLGIPVVRQVVPGIGTPAAVVVAILLAVLLGLSVLLHELGHCLAARAYRIPVLEVRLYLVGGVSELGRSPVTARGEALIAAAGPGVSALLAVGCGLLAGSTTTRTVGWLLLVELCLSNAIVAVFNILPALPLDGGRVLRAGVWRLTRRRWIGTAAGVVGGLLVALALVIWAIVLLVGHSRAAFLQAGIAVVMAIFVGVGAWGEWPRINQHRWPAGVSIASLAHPVVQLPAELPISLALTAAGSRAIVLVAPDGHATGVLEPAAAMALLHHAPQSPASLAASDINPAMVVLPDDQPVELLDRLGMVDDDAFLLVDAAARPTGVLFRADILRAVAKPRRPSAAVPGWAP